MNIFKKTILTVLASLFIIGNVSAEKIKIVLNLTTFLSSDDSAETNVKSLETIIDNIDHQVCQLLC